MPCNLSKDPTGQFDAFATSGQTATVFIKCESSPQAKVTAATLAGVKATVANDGKVQLPAFPKNTSMLNLTIEGTQTGDDIQLLEDCENSQVLSTQKVGAGASGSNPVVGFKISAS